MQDIILLKQGEIVLKGLNKKYFEQKLISNVKRRLRSLGEFDVTCTQSTIYVEPKSDDIDMDETQQAMTKVFGIAAVVRAAACDKTPETMAQKAIEYMAEAMREAGSFKVETRRADKAFPMTSIEVSQYVGGELAEAFPETAVDVHNPELTVHVEVRERAAYIHRPPLPGAVRCAAFKVKPQITPFAVVVRLIQVDRGGYFFVPFAALGLFQCHGMDHTAFQQLQPYCVPRAVFRSTAERTLYAHQRGGRTLGLHQFSGHIRQLLAKTFALNAIVFCQHRPDRLFQGFIDLPQVRVQGVSPRCRIRHIKDIVQARVSAGFIQQRNALGTTPDVTVHAPADKITVSLPIAILAVCRTENFCISSPD